jgi:hypothetical protein
VSEVGAPPEVWAILGIAPTRDTALIRKAYAAHLKQSHPEENPSRFQRLRAAYETALRMAKMVAAGAVPHPKGLPSDSGATTALATPPTAMAAPQDDREINSLFDELARLLKSPDALDPTAYQHALDALLNSPAAFHIGAWGSLERRLAQLILESVPKSDTVAASLVKRLGWAHADVSTRRAKEVLAVVTRVADLEAVGKLQTGTDPGARAFQLLSRPAPKSWLVRRARAFLLDDAMQDFFQKVLRLRPSVGGWLDQTSVVLWMRIFGRPHVRLRALIAMPVFSFLAIIGALAAVGRGAIPDDSRRTAILAAACVGPVIVLLRLYAFGWPAHLLLVKLKGKPPPTWIRWGWLPASAVGVVLVSSLGVSLLATAFSIMLVLCFLVWASVAASPIFVAEGLSFTQKWRFSIVRNLVMLLWMILVFFTIGIPAGIVVAGALGASDIAGLPLSKMWILDVPKRTRRQLLGALLIVTVTALYSLWSSAADAKNWARFSTALVTAVVLLHRPVQANLSARAAELRLRLMAFVLVPAYAILGPYLSDHPALALRWMGTLLVIGVMVVVVLSIFKELMSDRMTTKVALVSRLLSGFFNRQSALLPTTLGLALLGGGGYGLLVLANYQGVDWVLYAAVAGTGLYVLKRTFSVAD